MQTCRYGVSYEISSRQISKKVIFLRSMCVSSCFFLVLLGKSGFGWFSCCFHCCLATCVAFRPPPLFTGSTGHPSCIYIFIYFTLSNEIILSPCTICLPRVLCCQIPFRLFQLMFCYLWITILQTSLVPLYLNKQSQYLSASPAPPPSLGTIHKLARTYHLHTHTTPVESPRR